MGMTPHVYTGHLPLVLLIDISSSTEDIRELINKCQKKMLRAMAEKVSFKNCVYLYILHFNGRCQEVVNFELLDSLEARGALRDDSEELDIKRSYGCTNPGKAIKVALQAADTQKIKWGRADNVYQPLMFLLTDGYPDAGQGATDEEKKAVEREYCEAAAQIKQREKKDAYGKAKITFAAAGIQRKNGCSANIARLKELTSDESHVIAVTDAEDGDIDVAGLAAFYQMVYTATDNTLRGTQNDDLNAAFFDAVPQL